MVQDSCFDVTKAKRSKSEFSRCLLLAKYVSPISAHRVCSAPSHLREREVGGRVYHRCKRLSLPSVGAPL